MKKFSILLLSFLAITATISCSDEDEDLFIGNPSAADILLAPGSATFEVNETNQGDLAERFSWTAIEFDTPVQVTYELQLDFAGNQFADPEVITSTPLTNAAVTYGRLNDIALELGIEAGTATPMEMRVVATTADSSMDAFTSNVVSIALTPFEAYLFTDLYLVGAATAPGWSNNNENPALFRDASDENVFHYTGFFNADLFKVLSDLGNWQPQYGVENGGLGLADGTGGPEPDTFAIPTAGYYDFVMDISGITNDDAGDSSFTITPNASAASSPTYSSIGFLGTVLGDNGFGVDDIDLVQSSFDVHQWSARNVTLASGELKFRANNDWSTNWGSNTEYSGQGVFNGDNIPVRGGVYNIFFNDIDGRYILIPVEE
ncbi:MAG: SusE domain-containing protein [Nonlabens sp.]